MKNARQRRPRARSNAPLSQHPPGIGTLLDPGMLYIDGFLTPDQCARILHELDTAAWERSLTYQPQQDGEYLDMALPLRVSQTAHQQSFSAGLRAMLRGVERRIERLFGVPPAYLEAWQAADYPQQGRFGYHLDAGYFDDDPAGDRVLTFLVYLTTPLKGGGTHFLNLDQYVTAEAGRLVVWENLLPDGRSNPDRIHAGTPVLRGRKTTLVNWQRQRVCRT